MDGQESSNTLSGRIRSNAGDRGQGEKDADTGLHRIFNFTQLASFMLSYMASWEAITANVAVQLANGGPRAMFWGLLVAFVGIACQYVSFTEMSSMLPIAGAQYHWTWVLAPPEHRRYITWMQGWISWTGWIAVLAGAVNLAANITTTLASESYPEYRPQGWHTVLIMWALVIALGLLNTFAFFLVPYLEMVSAVIHVFLFIGVLVVLLCLGSRHTAGFAFFADTTASGWTNDFITFMLGSSFLAWGFVGFDSGVHIAEETKNSKHVVPRSIFYTLIVNYALTIVMVAVLLLRLGDVHEVMTATYPLMTIFRHATGSVPAASGMIAPFAWINITSCAGSLASTSRLTWAWARDGALPAYFAQIDPGLRIPVHSIWLPIGMVMLLSLLNIAHYAAFAVIISLSSFGLYLSYGIAIACMLHARCTHRAPSAPWSLGRWGILINAYAVVHSAFFGLFMVFPAHRPITAANMNYALPITMLVWTLATLVWFAWARKGWRGLDEDIIKKIKAP